MAALLLWRIRATRKWLVSVSFSSAVPGSSWHMTRELANFGGHKHHQPSGEAHLSAQRLIQKIEVLSSEVLDSCAFCQRLQHLVSTNGVIQSIASVITPIHTIQVVLYRGKTGMLIKSNFVKHIPKLSA